MENTTVFDFTEFLTMDEQRQSTEDQSLVNVGPPRHMFRIPDDQALIEGGIQAVISVLGTLGNLVLVVFILACPHPLQGHHVLLSSMGLGDMLMSLVYTGYSSCRTLRHVWLLPKQMCIIMSCFGTFFPCLKAAHFLLLACDRYTYLSNIQSHAQRFSVIRMLIISGMMWIFLFGITFWGVFTDPRGDHVQLSLGATVTGLGCGTEVVEFENVIQMLLFLLPVLICLVFYLLLACKERALKPTADSFYIKVTILALTFLFFFWFLTYMPMFIFGILLKRVSKFSMTLGPVISRSLVYLSYFSCFLTPLMFACFPRLFRQNGAHLRQNHGEKQKENGTELNTAGSHI